MPRDLDVLDYYNGIRAQVGLPPALSCPFSVISGLLHPQNGVPALDPPREAHLRQVQHVGALTLTGCVQGQIMVTLMLQR